MPTPRPLPTREILQQRFEVRKGRLFFKEIPLDFFGASADSQAKAFLHNADLAGTLVPIGTRNKYYSVGVDGYSYLLHRVIWKMAHGTEPEAIDHIDGDSRNNQIGNLRAANSDVNGKNLALNCNNKSGKMGVLRAASGNWTATIGHNGERVSLGTFDSFEAAVAAREAAEKKYGYHENHGRKVVEFKGNEKRDLHSTYVQSKSRRTKRLKRGHY